MGAGSPGAGAACNGGRARGRAARRWLVWGVVAVCCPALGRAQTITQDEALRLAFPAPASIERRTAFLSVEQLGQAEQLAGPGVRIASPVVTYYQGRAADGRLLGTAYFDAHRVRTLTEVLMIVVSPDGEIDRIEVVRFYEPPEYRPDARWLRLLYGRPLDDALALKGAVPNLAGATLTARAAVEAARRVLAVHQVIAGGGR